MNTQSSEPQASPAAMRNAPVIGDVIARVLSGPAYLRATVLEVAGGYGYHAVTFARRFPELVWQPSDGDTESFRNMTMAVSAARLPNLRTPLQLDVRKEPWPAQSADAVVCINMIHISPWEATIALFRGAAKLLAAGHPILTYGPYSISGDFLAQSNIDFDHSLRERNPTWGIRDVMDVQRTAREYGFSLEETVRMPANNLMLIFRKV